ncbi:hydantoinase/oxoprolinase family protein [Elongatibacter sediminis]|uniref:Hydantoinase/oxoprolinase family protein n=1 Tax=Elongatibacter sediminis TaxID=3119006 RepID=A0AAW9RIR4_9GAMM
MTQQNRLRVGVDIGGTFTDLVAFDDARGGMLIAKTPSVPGEYSAGVINALDEVIDDYGEIELFINGTTAPLNAFLERKGARTALITTRGFGDVYVIRRSNRSRMYDLHYTHAEPLVPRRHTFEVEERLNARGEVVTPLNEADLRKIVGKLRQAKIESVALCFLHSYINPEHERLAAEFLRREAPEIFVSPSYEICREWREYERTSTAVINAYVSPILKNYLGQLETALTGRGYDDKVFLMQSNGGLIDSGESESKALLTLMSGPVGACVGSGVLSRKLDEPNMICIDMGGTSFEVSLVVDGKESVVLETNFEGFPIRAPMVDIHSVGAGGGSIAWSESGALRVGPKSAGAQPGPACYGRGGTEPTVTDANVVLGRIDPDTFLGGRMKLDEEAARTVVGEFARSFEFGIEEMAEGILNVINSKMANAIRTMTISKGIDPREFSLIAFGGAGPMHAMLIAEELEIGRVIVPNVAGQFSAWGMLNADIRHDQSQPINLRLSGLDWEAVNQGYTDMETRLADLLKDEGVAEDQMRFLRYLEMRYISQEYTLSVPVPDDVALGADDAAALKARFDELYLQNYGHSNPQEEAQVANIRVEARGLNALQDQEQPALLADEDAAAPDKTREVVFAGQRRETPFVDRANLQQGEKRAGPMIIVELSCTTVVPPDWEVEVDAMGNLLITKTGGSKS